MTEVPNVRLSLSNAPQSVAIVREALLGLAEILALDALETDDLCTAVTEACKNVVYHAYEGQEGPLELEVYTFAGVVDVVVRDHGIGIRPHVGERTQPHTGIGLPIVHALTHRVAYTNIAGGGTEMRMQFAMPGAPALEPDPDAPEATALAGSEQTLSVSPSGLSRAVVPRVLRAVRSSGASDADR
jgi:anti-sigma regulatory factor (Ser/Thr protein kinase)